MALDLGDALDVVVGRFKSEFPAFKSVVAEDESRSELLVPAILVQISEIEPVPEDDPLTGQFPALVKFEARVILGHRTPEVRRSVVRAAAALAGFVHNNRLGVAWGPAQIVALEPDEFAPQADQFDIWRLEWGHLADLGDQVVFGEEFLPQEVLISWAPDIGPPHEDDYIPAISGAAV